MFLFLLIKMVESSNSTLERGGDVDKVTGVDVPWDHKERDDFGRYA